MSYAAVLEIVEQAQLLETLGEARGACETDKGEALVERHIEETQAHIDQLISQLKPKDRYRLQRLVAILRDRLDVSVNKYVNSKESRRLRGEDGGVEIQGFGDDATVIEWEHGHG